MKMCNNPDEAFHQDCCVCDEDCEFRKPQPNRWDFFLFTIYLVILITALYLSLS